MLDRFNLCHATIIVLCALFSRIQQLRYGELPEATMAALGIPEPGFTGIVDLCVVGTLFVAWVVAMVYFSALARRRFQAPRTTDESLFDPQNMFFDDTVVVPPLRVDMPPSRKNTMRSLKTVARTLNTFKRSSSRRLKGPDGSSEQSTRSLSPTCAV